MAAGDILTVDDLSALTSASPAALAVMIADVSAAAVSAAPCLNGDLPESARAAARAVLRGAVLRWADYTTRDERQMTAGPFTLGQAAGSGGGAERRALLWPSEIQSLQRVCSNASGRRRGRAYMGWLA